MTVINKEVGYVNLHICDFIVHNGRIMCGNHPYGFPENGATGTAFLNHSCDEWVIGGLKDVKALIENLKEIQKYMEGKERDV